MTTIVYNSIVRETEKAVLVSVPVTWGSRKHNKEMWIPKSSIEAKTNQTMNIQDWYIQKQEYANMFHGYVMRFDVIK